MNVKSAVTSSLGLLCLLGALRIAKVEYKNIFSFAPFFAVICILVITHINYDKIKTHILSICLIASFACFGFDSRCSNCQIGDTFYWPPIFASVFVSLMAVFLLFFRNKPTLNIAVGITGLASIFYHIYLISITPKICPFCLTLVFFALVISLHCIENVFCKEINIIYFPKIMRIFLIAISFTSVIFHCFVTIGVLKSAYQKNALPQRNFKGLKMKDFIGESSAIKSPCILFLTQSGCIACEKGRESLKKLGIINVELPVCSTPFQKDACLSMDLSESGSKATVVTPTFLVVNRKGVVVYQASGWSDDHDSQTTLKHTLAEWMKD